MIIKSAEFIKSAVKPMHFPEHTLPEVAFAGRSNVGKSSLINTLINRKRLVKTGGTPGRTRLINFFDINNTLCFVDLPGYGYANVPESVRRSWGGMVEAYLRQRENLQCVVLLVDIRRMPGTAEIDFIAWLNRFDIACILVATKADKLSRSKQMARRQVVAQALEKDRSEVILFSTKTRQGKDVLWDAMIDRMNEQLGA